MPDDGYVVRRPREADAIGKALQHAFACDCRLPSEFQRSLERLDRRR